MTKELKEGRSIDTHKQETLFWQTRINLYPTFADKGINFHKLKHSVLKELKENLKKEDPTI